MIEHYSPFTIHQGEYAVYLADGEGETAGRSVYMGGRFEDLSPEATFTGERLDRHGDPFGRTVHVDERHSFTIRNLWAVRRGRNILPQPKRGETYVFVAVFQDQRTTAWAKRIYFGVTADGQRLPTADEVVRHEVPFTAAAMFEQSGLGKKPDMTATLLGEIRYLAPGEDVLLYFYDFATGIYTTPFAEDLQGRARIVTDSTQFRVDFWTDNLWVPAMKVTSSRLAVNEITAAGGTFLPGNQARRLEWRHGLKRIASLSAEGELAVPDIEETLAEPLVKRGFRVAVNGAWAATIGPHRAYAREFAEIIVSGEIRYVTATENVALYRYFADEASGVYRYFVVDEARLAGRARFATSLSFFRIDFNGVQALKATGSELRVNELTVLGDAALTGSVHPRIEWRTGRNWLASLSAAGELASPRAEETDTPVPADQGFPLVPLSGTWGAAIGPNGARAREFSEFLSDLLFEFSPGESLSAVGGSHVRSSGAAHQTTAAGGVELVSGLRDAHYVNTFRTVLLEAQRTNLLARSSEFNEAPWAKTGVTVTANAGMAPNGQMQANRMVTTGGAVTDRVTQTVAVNPPSGAVYTFSVWVRNNGGVASIQFVSQELGGALGAASASSGAFAITNEWQRITWTRPAIVQADRTSVSLQIRGGTTGTHDLLLWGAQMELAGQASSKIATGAGPATRSADVLSFALGIVPAWTRYERYFDNAGVLQEILVPGSGNYSFVAESATFRAYRNILIASGARDLAWFQSRLPG
jgi:hypothetical protein